MQRICECCGQPIGQRKARKVAPSFKGYDDFVPAFNAARAAIAAELGTHWHLRPDAWRWARVPAAWARCPVYGRVSTAPRDMRIPLGQYWPAGELPSGPEYAELAAYDLIPMREAA